MRRILRAARDDDAHFGRNNYPAHQDHSRFTFFTFNIQLSDIEKQEGGLLWACNLFPQTYLGLHASQTSLRCVYGH